MKLEQLLEAEERKKFKGVAWIGIPMGSRRPIAEVLFDDGKFVKYWRADGFISAIHEHSVGYYDNVEFTANDNEDRTNPRGIKGTPAKDQEATKAKIDKARKQNRGW